MPELLIKDMDDDVVRTLADRARMAGRSIEEEARSILRRALRPGGPGTRLLEHFAGAGLTDEEFGQFEVGIAASRAGLLRGAEASE